MESRDVELMKARLDKNPKLITVIADDIQCYKESLQQVLSNTRALVRLATKETIQRDIIEMFLAAILAMEDEIETCDEYLEEIARIKQNI